MRVDPRADVVVEQQGVLALPADHAFHAAHQPDPAHVADDRDVAQRLQPGLQVGADRPGVVHQPLVLHDLDVLQRRRAGHGVPRIGIAVREHRALGRLAADLGEDAVRDQYGAQGLVT